MSTTTISDADAPAAKVSAPDATRKKKSRKTLMVMLTVGAAAAVAGVAYYTANRGLETTDDAQIDADIVSIPARTASTVIAVHFTENQAVKAGALLVELDPEPAKARLAQAEANLEAAK